MLSFSHSYLIFKKFFGNKKVVLKKVLFLDSFHSLF